MEFAEADNMEKYRKYIQKRRVTPAIEAEKNEIESDKEENKEKEFSSSKVDLEADYFSSTRSSESKGEQDSASALYQSMLHDRSSTFGRSDYHSRGYSGASSTLRRTDSGLYKKLYQSGRRYSPTQSAYRSYTGAADVEDNRATIMAVKLIKQALACFAILGIIVFMQGRGDMADILATIKKQVIETHIEPQGIYQGIQDFVAQCSRVLGGSP